MLARTHLRRHNIPLITGAREPAVIYLNYVSITQNLSTKTNYDIPESIRRRRYAYNVYRL